MIFSKIANPPARLLSIAAIASLSACQTEVTGGTDHSDLIVATTAKTDRTDRFPQVSAKMPNGVEAIPHVEFANYGGYRPLQLDLYVHGNRNGTDARPLIVWIHGGSWWRGDARGSGAFADYPAVLAAIAARGYVVASVDYRLAGEARFPAQIQDVKAAIRFLRSKAKLYGIDPNRVFAWGGSAGGHLAALAATSCGVAEFDPPASTGRLASSAARTAKPLPQSDCVQAAAAWYGPFDLTDDSGHSSSLGDKLQPLIGCRPKDCPDLARKASPIGYVTSDDAPMLLLHGMADTQVGPAQSRNMVAALEAAGVQVDVQFYPESGHGFFGADEQATRDVTLDALNRTLRFFDAAASRP